MAHVAATSFAMAAAAAERRVVEQLRGKGAISHERATTFVAAQRGDERWLRSLLDRGVVVEAASGRYWLNERTLRSRASKTKVLIIALLALLALMLGIVLLGVSMDPGEEAAPDDPGGPGSQARPLERP